MPAGTWAWGSGSEPTRVQADAHDLAAWLSGRRPADVVAVSGGSPPELGPWP